VPKVWVDLANSPQVMFFAPLIREMERRGIDVLTTARDFSETVPLAKYLGLNVRVVGRHGGKSKLGKAKAMLSRVASLANLLRGRGIDLALSHNSYDAILAGRLLRTTVWTYMDYDLQPANHLAFRLAHRVFVQEWFPEDALRRYGASGRKVVRYRGLKEEVYLRDFSPDPDFLRTLGEFHRPLIVARPPSTSSLYTAGYGEFWEVLSLLKGRGYDVRVIRRNPEDASMAKSVGVRVLPRPIDGPQLLYWSDAFVGGGGTMTREAVILGTRTFSVFPAPGFLDRKLMDLGLVESLSKSKARRVEIRERRHRNLRFFNRNLRDDLLEFILNFLNR